MTRYEDTLRHRAAQGPVVLAMADADRLADLVAAVREEGHAYECRYAMGRPELCDCLMRSLRALDEVGPTPAPWVGPLLTAEQWAEIQRHDLWTEAEQAAIVRHVEAAWATIRNQNAELAARRDAVETADAPWRTGRHRTDEPGPRQRPIYGANGELIGVMFTTEDARLAVDSVNGVAEVKAAFRLCQQGNLELQADVGRLLGEMEALRAEVRRALYLTPLGEVMGHGVMADQVPQVAALLRDVPPEPASR